MIRIMVVLASIALSATPAARHELGQRHPDLPVWVDQRLETEGVSWASLSGEELATVAESVVNLCPLRWSECNLYERKEHGGGPMRFMRHQRAALLWPYALAIKAAYETGKTRLMLALGCYTLDRGGSFLYGTNSGTTSSNFLEDLQWHRDHSPNKDRMCQVLTAVETGNITLIKGRHGNYARIIIAGPSGSQFNSCHIGGQGPVPSYLFADEADLWPDDAWATFNRCAGPGVYQRVVSVPNGPAPREFERRWSSGIPLKSMMAAYEGETTLWEGRELTEVDLRSEYASVLWTREVMPPPFWHTEEARRVAVRDFGPPGSPRYEIYINARRSASAAVVFSPTLLAQARLRTDYTDRFRFVEITGQLHEGPRMEVRIFERGDDDELMLVEEEGGDLSTAEIVALVLRHIDGGLVDASGFDAGRSVDPSQWVLAAVRRGHIHITARIKFARATTATQWQVMAEGLKAWRPSKGLGIEASGKSHGAVAIFDNLVGPGGISPRNVTAFDWSSTREVIVSGKKKAQKKAKRKTHQTAVKLNLKELSTQAVEECLRTGTLHAPKCDADQVREFDSHTTRGAGKHGRTFQFRDDDIVDAVRALALRIQDRKAAGKSHRARAATRTR